MSGRIVASALNEEERAFDTSLRPRTLAEFIGQEQVKEGLALFIRAAKERGEPLDHVLLYGPPGLGKTAMAHVIANELGVGIQVTSGPAVERPGDLAAILTNLGQGDVLFIDEIHRLSRVVEEILYPAMEDFALDIVIGKGPSARSLRLGLPRFTLVGATTRAGLITSALRDRFGVVNRLDFYTPGQLGEIVARSASLLRVEVSAEGAAEIARRARGTPRVANRLLRRVRDYAQVRADGRVSGAVSRKALALLGVDEAGLDSTDHRFLEALAHKFAGGPAGVETLAAAIGEEPETLEDVYEPYLMQLGLLQRTQRGRLLTEAGRAYLGLESGSQGSLF